MRACSEVCPLTPLCCAACSFNAPRFEQQQQVRMAVIAAERGALQQQLSQLHLAAAELGSAARLSQAEQQQEALSAALQQADQEHAARVAAIMDKLQVKEAAAACCGCQVVLCNDVLSLSMAIAFSPPKPCLLHLLAALWRCC